VGHELVAPNERRQGLAKREEVSWAEIQARLLGIIAVKGLPQTEQIAVLSRVGFTPKAIADVLGTSANTVRVTLVMIRKAERAGYKTLKALVESLRKEG